MVANFTALEGLTAKQRAAVLHRGTNALVQAVPGSGKTRVIVARCASLMADGVPASAILLLTFSRRAVSELHARLVGLVGISRLPAVRTFHGFAARLLHEAGTAGDAGRLLSEPAQRTLFAHVATSCVLGSLPAGIGSSAEFRDAVSVRVDELRRCAAAERAKLAAQASPRIFDLLTLEKARRALRNRLGVADFDDLIARCLALAATPQSAIATILRDRYRHVLVDEFQDTESLQLGLLERFGAEIFAVGDAAQAIYGFRGAARDALARARRALAMTTLPLDESFRCPTAMCDLARSVWPHAPEVSSRVPQAGIIGFRRAVSLQDEAALVAQTVAAAIEGGLPEPEIAILVRSAEPMARLIERELRTRGIAVAREGGENVREDRAVDVICAALRAFAQPADPAGWVELLGHPVFGFAPLALRLALDGEQPTTVDAACALIEQFGGAGRISGLQLGAALRAAHALWESDDIVGAARALAADGDVLGFIIASEENDAYRSGRRLTHFFDALADVRDICSQLDVASSCASVFAAFMLGSQGWRSGATTTGDQPGVRVLTVHAAKGLEFDFVVIADAVDGRFPQPLRADALLTDEEVTQARTCGVDLGTRPDEQIAAERSLWYVAVTRSKRELLITWSEIDLDGSPQRPSRFIPLGERSREQQPSFRGLLEYPVAALSDVQPAMPASLDRPLATSSLATWFSCRRKFYYGALLRIGADQYGFRAKLGTLVHRTIQEFHGTIRDFRGVDEGAHRAWSAALRALARASIDSLPATQAFDSPVETNAALRSADRLLDRYARSLEFSARATAGGFAVIASEESVAYVVGGVTLWGRIDRIDELADGTLALVDIKSAAFTPDKAMVDAFVKLAGAMAGETLWSKAPPAANPQLALYRHAQPKVGTLAYIYLDARPKRGEFIDAAAIDRLELARDAGALAAIDSVLTATFFEPWESGAVTSLEPTRVARTCRTCEFVPVCPGFLEDDD